jgi:hydroxymethylbilane synthase
VSTAIHTATLRLGTRRSALATVQAELIAGALRAAGHRVDLVGVTTTGDRSASAGEPLVDAGGVGVFVGELRSLLLAGEIDLVVHSLKDLPTTPHDELSLAAVPLRDDPRDALVARDGRTLAQLPSGAVVGTGSPRRAAQLRAARRDLEVRQVRGNVDTRLRKVADGEFDAVVLATAGLRRLGRLGEASEVFDPEVMVPAPGQGALAIECRAADRQLASLLELLDDPASRAAVSAERAVLASLEAGCTAPMGAYGVVTGATESGLPSGWQLSLTAIVVSVDGTTTIRRSLDGSLEPSDSAGSAARFGRELAGQLIEAGAAAVIGESA